ncbi:hypothetical protein CLOM_g19215 [Closterium sp. NIES-68]|nr:hypothetical protein CLOM_g19215 [Closterium sp. NIES-68]
MLEDFGSAEAMRERNETPVAAGNGLRHDDVTPPAQGLLDLERAKNSSGGVPLPMEEENQRGCFRGNPCENIADFLMENSPQMPQNLADDLPAQFPGRSAEKYSSKHSSSGLRGALSQFDSSASKSSATQKSNLHRSMNSLQTATGSRQLAFSTKHVFLQQ